MNDNCKPMSELGKFLFDILSKPAIIKAVGETDAQFIERLKLTNKPFILNPINRISTEKK